MLVAAMNLCPYGYFGDLKRECRCGPVQAATASGSPARSSIASISTSKFRPSNTATSPAPEPKKPPPPFVSASSAPAKNKQARFHADAKVNCNARMGLRQIKRHCRLSDDSQDLIRVAMTELNLSACASDRILKVSRTVSDLAASDPITPKLVSEAIQYRTFDRMLWV